MTNKEQTMTGYRLNVYKADRRVKTGERVVRSYEYPSYTETAIQNEVKHLQAQLYKPADGWRLEFEPLTVLVKSLMTGELVMIDYRLRGTGCDPSMERYWTM
jgi:hypothetical protein